jgi:hypothetical protein
MTRVLVAALLLTAICLLGSRKPSVDPSHPVKRAGDQALFDAVVKRVRQGEPYYPAMASELRARHYPMRSVFNWRTPLLFEGLARSSPQVLVWILPALTIVVCMAVATSRVGQPLLTAALLIGTATAPPLFTEAWAGLLIGVSVVATLRNRPIPAVIAGLGAAFVRELALPYAAVCLSLAGIERRLRPLAWWIGGLALFALFFWYHATKVAAVVAASDPGQSTSWIQFGGLTFLVTALQVTGWLALLPRTAAAFCLALLVLVVWSRDAPPIVRASLLAYGLFFSVVGQPFNWYWGLVVGPLACLGLGYAPIAIKGLLRNVRERPRRAVAHR